MKILIITHYFPPKNSIASLRPYSWSKYWTLAGHEVTVLTTQKGKTDVDLNLPNQGFEVMEIPSKVSRVINRKKNTKTKTNVGIKSYLKRKISQYSTQSGALLNDTNYPNIYMFWKRPAIEAVMKSGKYYDVAVATHAPFVTFMIASELKKRGIINKIVFDFRDLWIDNHLYTGIPLFSSYEKKLEKRLCDLADKITVVSDGLANVLQVKFGKQKVHTISNGFDLDDLSVLSKEHYFNNDKINIVYTGAIYVGHRDPIPLFKAIKELREELYEIEKLNVCFAGLKSYPIFDEIIEDYGVGDVIHFCDRLPREDALKMQRDADILIFLEDNLAETDGILTGKLFEYMFSGTPIWTIGRKWQPSRMIEEYNLGRSFGDDVKMIKDALINLLQGEIPNKNNMHNILEIEKYTRKYQADCMMEIIKTL